MSWSLRRAKWWVMIIWSSKSYFWKNLGIYFDRRISHWNLLPQNPSTNLLAKSTFFASKSLFCLGAINHDAHPLDSTRYHAQDATLLDQELPKLWSVKKSSTFFIGSRGITCRFWVGVLLRVCFRTLYVYYVHVKITRTVHWDAHLITLVWRITVTSPRLLDIVGHVNHSSSSWLEVPYKQGSYYTRERSLFLRNCTFHIIINHPTLINIVRVSTDVNVRHRQHTALWAS